MVTLQTSVSVQKNVIPSRELLGNIHFPWNHHQKHHSGKISYFLFPTFFIPVKLFIFCWTSYVDREIWICIQQRSVEKLKFSLTWRISREINLRHNLLLKTLISRNFCQRVVRVKLRNFHTANCNFLAVLLWYYM